MTIPRVLSIAGSDSGGGAGIQADLKAFAACGVHGMTAITAITAQNTVAVTRVEAVSPEMILAQVRAVADDIGVDAVKIGMLGTGATIEAVAEALDELGEDVPVVVDPVMVSESGSPLLEADARAALAALIVPRTTVLTPNLAEAEALAGGGGSPEELARRVHALGARYVVVTGGHQPDDSTAARSGEAGPRAGSIVEEAIDVFFDGDEVVEIPGERHPGGAAHGSGCTHSAALAAHLALGFTPLEAARAAKAVAAAAVRDGLREIGAGVGPVDALGIRDRGRSRAGAAAQR